MSTTVALFFSLLTVMANLATLGLLVAGVAARWSPGMASRVAHLRGSLRSGALAGAWLVALAATLGSLYFSEVAGFEPCRLCWYQRIAMYPLSIILLVAAIRRDPGVTWYAAPLVVVGGFISTYHVFLEWFPQMESGACGIGPACTLVWFRELGYVTLPTMALSASLLVLALLWLAQPADRHDPQRPSRPNLEVQDE